MKRCIPAVFVMAGLLFFHTGCRRNPDRLERQDYVLGTACSIIAYDASDSLLDAVFHSFKDIEDRMKVSGEKSEVAQINAQAGMSGVKVSEDTLSVIRDSLEFSALAPGSFDITVSPLVALWGIGVKESPAVPPKEEINRLKALIDYRNVHINGNSVYLAVPGMGIDLGGIAKGYAADVARDMLRKKGVRHALVDLGGNILALGTKPDGSPWRIGIQDPSSSRGRYIGIVHLVGKTAVTSGPYERFFIEDGIRYHHILDPSTGYPADSGVVSVTIVADSSMRADALSTMVYILGLEKGMEIVNSLPGTDAVIVLPDKSIHVSEGISESFQVTDTAYHLIAP